MTPGPATSGVLYKVETNALLESSLWSFASSCRSHFNHYKYRAMQLLFYYIKNSVALARERAIQTERPPLVREVSASFWGYRMSRGQRNGSPRPYSRLFRLDFLLYNPSSFFFIAKCFGHVDHLQVIYTFYLLPALRYFFIFYMTINQWLRAKIKNWPKQPKDKMDLNNGFVVQSHNFAITVHVTW
jgi:hypothetical protein